MDIPEYFAMQHEIIKLQEDVINDLILQLLQYTTAEEIEGSSVKDKIDRAADIRAELGD